MSMHPILRHRTLPTRAAQHGDTLIEALVAILLAAILAVGFAFIASRAQQAQRYTFTQGIAVAQLRNGLTRTGLEDACSGTALAPIAFGAGNGKTTVTPSVDSSSCTTHDFVVSLGDGSAPETVSVRSAVQMTASSDDVLGGQVTLQSQFAP